MTRKTQIAILGGGIGALTAAFELTEQDPEKTRYEITVYTLGWRLGGKGLVGRDELGRALEHGLHVWAGFYDNAFDLVQRLYARLKLPPDAWREKFEGLNHFTTMEFVDDSWKPWLLEACPNVLDPGIDQTGDLAPLALLRQLLSWAEQCFVNSLLADYLTPIARTAMQRKIAAVLPVTGNDVFPTPLSAIRALLDRWPSDPKAIPSNERHRAFELVEAFRAHVASAVAAAPKDDDEVRRLNILYDLAAGLIRGILSEEVLSRGFDEIDGLEWSDWMKDNCCRSESLESAVVRGCYDYVFGYVGGKRKVGAGVGTRALLRLLLTYKGSIFYALREPMGDFLFAPLYLYLRQRKVKFKFFHRLDKLHLSEDGTEIQEIVLGRQVKLKNPNAEYEPLIDIPGKNFKSWPIHPDYDQIENGNALKTYNLESAWTNWADADCPLKLQRQSSSDHSDTFDIAILAVGFGGLPSICKELSCRYDTWSNCLNQVKTTQTLALQLWLTKDTDQLGWHDPRTVMVGFARKTDDFSCAPLHSWEDNTPLLATEIGGKRATPRSLAYFVSVFPDAKSIPEPPDPEFPSSEIQRAKDAIVPWMNKRLPVLWPKAYDAKTSGFCWELLDAPPGTIGPKRLDSQYVRTNIDPWERYVLSVPGTLQFRLWPDRSGISNLFLAGDWVRTGLDAGCIEAAVMSGRAAARAITGGNMFIPGYGNSRNIPVPISLLPVVNLLKQLKTGVAGGVGSMEGYFVTIWRDPKDVAQLLPPGLHLDPPSDLKPPPKSCGSQPIVFLFSRQRNVRPGFVPFGGMRYHEIIELIPFVQRDSLDAPSGGPFNYMPYLFLDEITPVWIGVNLYGFNKRLARIASDGGSFELQSDIGEIRANLSEGQLPGRATRFPYLKSVRQLVERPFISLTTNGVFVYSYLDFHFDTASFQGVSGEVGLGAPFDPKSSAPEKVEVCSIVDADFGAFRFQTNWDLSVPLSAGAEEGSFVPPDLQAFASTLLAQRRP